jgi:DNA repair protein RadC
LVNITKLTTHTLSEEVIIPDDNQFIRNTLNYAIPHLEKELRQLKEYSFIITFKKLKLIGIHIIGIGDYFHVPVDVTEFTRILTTEEADWVICCHNHPMKLNDTVKDALKPSSRDIEHFFYFHRLCSMLGIHIKFCIIPGTLTHALCCYFNKRYGKSQFSYSLGGKENKRLKTISCDIHVDDKRKMKFITQIIKLSEGTNEIN